MITRREWLAGTVAGLGLSKASLGREDDKKEGRKPAIFAFARFHFDEKSRNGGIFEIDPDEATWIKRSETGNMFARVSPNGEMLAYSQFGEEKLKGVFVQELAGGEPRKLTKLLGRAVWSPDGSELIVGNGGTVASQTQSEPGTWRVDLKTGRATKLAIEPGPQVIDWSRDGKSLLALDEKNEEGKGDQPLVVFDLQGKNRRVLFGEKNILTFDEHFSRDGERVHYSRYSIEMGLSNLQAWVVDNDGNKRERLYEKLDLDADPLQVRTSPDGKRSVADLWEWTSGTDKKKVYDSSNEKLAIIDRDSKTPRYIPLPPSQFIRLIDWV